MLKAPIILGLPRGGIPVAYEIALAIDAPLDVLVVCKVGALSPPELALGAISSGGVRIPNAELVAEFLGDDDSVIENLVAKETEELLRRDKLYRGNRPYPDLRDKAVVVVDDGMATGATMRPPQKR